MLALNMLIESKIKTNLLHQTVQSAVQIANELGITVIIWYCIYSIRTINCALCYSMSLEYAYKYVYRNWKAKTPMKFKMKFQVSKLAAYFVLLVKTLTHTVTTMATVLPFLCLLSALSQFARLRLMPRRQRVFGTQPSHNSHEVRRGVAKRQRLVDLDV